MLKNDSLFPSVLGYNIKTLKSDVSDLGIKSFVADQIADWVYKKHVSGFSEMRNISTQNQALLDKHFRIEAFSLHQQIPSDEGAIKLISTLDDGNSVECVILKEKTYNTLCVSSQCGCPAGCTFCLTGYVGFKRQLTMAEIVGQVYLAETLGYPITNLVFMGMGEPMLNFDTIFQSIDWMNDSKSFGIGKRNVTISTVGYLAGIKRLIKEERFVNLAFSVGHPNPKKRVQLMPFQERNPYMEVVESIKHYQSMHNRKLTLEYTTINGFNEDSDAIRELITLGKYLDAKINLINMNPHPKLPHQPISVSKLLEIKERIYREGVPVTVRYRKGQDIAAACGQLGESHLNS